MLSAAIERLLELRSRPKEITNWSDGWFEAEQLFVFETFLYIVAALLKAGAFATLHEVFTSGYMKPETDLSGSDDRFVMFDACYAYSHALNPILAPAGKRLLSPAAELIKRQAAREDLPFSSIIEADLIALLSATLNERTRWFPQTLFYAGYGRTFPFFLRATQHKHFKKLSFITGIPTAEELRTKVKEGLERMKVGSWTDFQFHGNVSFWNAMNMDKLDTIK